MKIKNTLLAAAALLLGGVSANAITYVDADLLEQQIASGGVYNNTFNILSPDGTSTFTVSNSYGAVFSGGETFNSVTGYNFEDITGGEIAFWFRNAQQDVFSVTVGLDTILANADSGAFVFLGQSLNASLIADLEADGTLSYTVTNLGPTPIRLDYALLRADAVDAPTGVADGGATLMLLGSALTGIGFLRRKLGLS